MVRRSKKKARRTAPQPVDIEPLDDDEDDIHSGFANLCAFDPGGTTGWSVMSVHPDALVEDDVKVLENIEHWAHGQFSGDEDKITQQMLELLEAWPDAVVVIEDFILRAYRKDDDLLSPVRITSKLEFGLQFWPGLYGVVPRIFKQQPSLAKSAVTDDRLREWGMYEREGGEEHARDADRHSLTFLRRAKESERLRKVAWPELYLEA